LCGRHQAANQGGCGQSHQQKAKTFDGPQRQQCGHGGGECAEGAGQRQQAQTSHHAGPQAHAIGPQTHEHRQAHAGELHHGQEETRLHQRQVQLGLQLRQSGWQLAHLQGRNATSEDNQPSASIFL
jgi:hypothetical protein